MRAANAERPNDLLEPPARRADAAAAWAQAADGAAPFLAEVGRLLRRQLDEFEPEVASAARQALHAGGKQLRPVLVALGAEAVARWTPGHATAAVVIEMVHLATLVHDDILDGASLRRQRPTLAAEQGNHVAVLLGDCLFAHALRLAAAFPTPEVCRAVAAATQTVCTGEILQTLRKGGFEQPVEDYLRIIRMKTGELFALACELGVSLAGAAAGVRSAARAFGLAFGTAYQIYDDCLDVVGSETLIGKTLGTDLAAGKLTLPLLLLHREADAGDRRWLEAHVVVERDCGSAALRDLLSRYEILERCNEAIQNHLGEACQHLTAFPDRPGRARLASLAGLFREEAARWCRR